MIVHKDKIMFRECNKNLNTLEFSGDSRWPWRSAQPHRRAWPYIINRGGGSYAQHAQNSPHGKWKSLPQLNHRLAQRITYEKVAFRVAKPVMTVIHVG